MAFVPLTAEAAEATAAPVLKKANEEVVPTQEVRDLLAKIALERFQQRFIEEEVDLETLFLFDDRDLADLGLPKGPRVKLLRALKDIFAPPRPEGLEKLSELTREVEDMRQEMAEKFNELGRRLEETSSQHQIVDEQLNEHALRFDALEESLATTNNQLKEVEVSQKANSKKQSLAHTADEIQRKADFEELTDNVQELSSSLRVIQELIPRRVCWDIRHVSEKMTTLPPGKYMRAPAFALCGNVVGLKLDFYPSGRHEALDGGSPEEGLLPDITPRKDGLKAAKKGGSSQLPEASWCSIGVCCPMGVKILYNLYVGQGHVVDNRSGEWTPTYHDFKMRWRDELEKDGSLRIVVTVLRVHNRRCPIEQDTIFIKSD